MHKVIILVYEIRIILPYGIWIMHAHIIPQKLIYQIKKKSYHMWQPAPNGALPIV